MDQYLCDQYLYFDIDGTLLHSRGAGSLALTRAFQETFHEPDFAGIVIHGSTDRGIAEQIFTAHGLEDSTENWQRFRDKYLEHLPGTLAERGGGILPGVIDLLEQLAELSHVHLGVLTGNMAAGAELKLAHFGLGDYFTFGAFGDEHHDRADIAHWALADQLSRTEQIDPRSIWIIGDTPNDIRCGKAIGAQVVAVATGSFSLEDLRGHEPDFLLGSLVEPREWIDSIPG
jgi:phosphoglycolate phosphatase